MHEDSGRQMYSDINCLYVYTRTKILVKTYFWSELQSNIPKRICPGNCPVAEFGGGLFFARSCDFASLGLLQIGRCPILVISPPWGYGFYISLQMFRGSAWPVPAFSRRHPPFDSTHCDGGWRGYKTATSVAGFGKAHDLLGLPSRAPQITASRRPRLCTGQ